MHSTASDGRDAPRELPALAVEAGLSAIALTDHDSTDGLAECAGACAAAGIDFVPGIELSAERGNPVGTMHILGYFVRVDAPALVDVADLLQEARDQRAPQIVEKLQAIGVDISFDEVRRQVAGRMIGRPHIAQVLVDKGYAKTISDAFAKYVGQRGAAYVRKDRLPTDRAIEAIHSAGGLAVLAHPIQLRCDDDEQLHAVVKRLVDQGLDGLECWHCDHAAGHVERYRQLARRYGLIATGGSDYHGPQRPTSRLGQGRVPRQVYDDLCAARRVAN